MLYNVLVSGSMAVCMQISLVYHRNGFAMWQYVAISFCQVGGVC